MVSNASPLVYLAMVGKLHQLRNLFGEIMIPSQVFSEICGAKDTPDSLLISTAVVDGWILTKMAAGNADIFAQISGIDVGEASAILLARKKKALLLIDDKMGRSAAEVFGVKCMGTVGMLLQSLICSLIDHDELVAILDRMIDCRFRLDSKVYRRAMKAAREISDEFVHK